jgi:hypothetical protein
MDWPSPESALACLNSNTVLKCGTYLQCVQFPVLLSHFVSGWRDRRQSCEGKVGFPRVSLSSHLKAGGLMNLRAKCVFSICLLGLLCVMLPVSLRANTIYTYTGNPYNFCAGTYAPVELTTCVRSHTLCHSRLIRRCHEVNWRIWL